MIGKRLPLERESGSSLYAEIFHLPERTTREPILILTTQQLRFLGKDGVPRSSRVWHGETWGLGWDLVPA